MSRRLCCPPVAPGWRRSRYVPDRGWRRSDDDVHVLAHQLRRERGHPIRVSLSEALLKRDVLPLDVPKLSQTLPEDTVSRSAGRYGREVSDTRDLRQRLCHRCEWRPEEAHREHDREPDPSHAHLGRMAADLNYGRPVRSSASHAARWTACHGVRLNPVPVALVGECSMPVV